MMKQRSPSIAVLGAGQWGKNLVRNFSELGVLAGVYDADPESLGAAAKMYGVRAYASQAEVFTDPKVKAVVVATPAATHFSVAREALTAGKDVFVEKPLSLSTASGKALVELADRDGRILMVGHLLWYHPAVIKLKALIDDGELGRIQYIYSNRLNLGRIRREENALWSFAPHDISVILGLLGEQPESVQSQGGNYLHEKLADVTMSLLSFPSGVKAHIFVSWLHPFKEQKLVVVGEKKMAVFDDLEPERKLVLYNHNIQWKNQVPIATKAVGESVAVVNEEPLRRECEHFLECVETRRKPRTDGREGLAVLSVLERCQEALDEKRQVSAPAAKGPDVKFWAHESAVIDDGVEIGAGTKIWNVSHILKGSRLGKACKIGQNVVIGPDVTIGDNTKVQNNVSIYKGVTLEDNVFCGPSMVFTNVFNPRSEVVRMDELRPTHVRHGASLGANCTIICGTTIGRYAFVAAGAVVTRDVMDYALVMGNPARRAGWMCVCGVKLSFESGKACCSCGKTYTLKNDQVTYIDKSPASRP